ncbi:MAG: SLC13 family permease [Polyangiales bacterium]
MPSIRAGPARRAGLAALGHRLGVALGAAMESSGLAAKLAQLALDVGASSPHAALAILFVLVAALTELVTNNAAAVLGFPLALELADRLGASPVPFVVVVMMAASASFLTPIGYQTNLMVYGPGGYKLRDYLTLGGVLSLVSAILVLLLVPWVFPALESARHLHRSNPCEGSWRSVVGGGPNPARPAGEGARRSSKEEKSGNPACK